MLFVQNSWLHVFCRTLTSNLRSCPILFGSVQISTKFYSDSLFKVLFFKVYL